MTGTVAAIVLAAGRGTRFGTGPKMLAEFRGRPLVHHVASAALASQASPVLVVVGHEAESISAALGGLPVAIVENPRYADGLATSLQAGLAALPDDTAAAVILLGDMPGVAAGLVDALIEAWRAANDPDAVVPLFEGRRGNPVLLSARLLPELRTLTGDAGAGALLRGRENVLELPVTDPAVLVDVDTPEALSDLRLT